MGESFSNGRHHHDKEVPVIIKAEEIYKDKGTDHGVGDKQHIVGSSSLDLY